MPMQDDHELAIFTDAVARAAGYNGHTWDTSLRDKCEHVCDPLRDRRIIYSCDLAEARVREDRNGNAEVCIFIWSSQQPTGIRLIRTPVPYLENYKEAKAYLKRVARHTERLSDLMQKVDDYTDKALDTL